MPSTSTCQTPPPSGVCAFLAPHPLPLSRASGKKEHKTRALPLYPFTWERGGTQSGVRGLNTSTPLVDSGA